MKGDAGQATLENILGVTAKLAFIQRLALPRDFLSVTGKAWVDQIVRRVAGEKASEMRRHVPARQLGLYAVYLMAREAQLTDAMVDLLIETVHKIGSRSKRKVVGDIAKDIERVYGKERLLVEIASASIDDPSGRICDVIFPIAGKAKLAAIVKESQAKGALDRRIYKVMRSSWANHYRRMLPSLLSVLEFRSNNAVWRPVLAALDWIRSKVDGGCRFVPLQDVPIDEVIPARWRSSVIDEEGRVNRISYELCVLAQLRDRIREVTARLHLDTRVHDVVGNLSGGLRRRVEIAKALLHRPRVLLMDEPSTGLDPAARRELWQYIADLRSMGNVTVLLTTHILDEADRADQLALLHQGRIVASGTPAELKARVGGDVVMLESADPGGLAASIQSRFGVRAAASGTTLRVEIANGHRFIAEVVEAFPGAIQSVALHKPTLEDVFLDETGAAL